MTEGCIAAGVLAIAWLGAIQGDRHMFGLPVWDGTVTSLVKPPATPIHPSKALYSAREAGSSHSLSSGSPPTSRVSSSSATSALSSLIDWEMAAAVIMVIGLAFLLYYGILEYLEEEKTTDSKIYGDKGTNTEPELQRTDLDAATNTQSDPKSYADRSTGPEPEDSRIYVSKGTNTEPEQQRTGLDAVTDTQSDPKSYADKSTGPEPEERATSVDAGTSTGSDLRDEVLDALRKDNNKKATHLDLALHVEKVEKEMKSLQGELRSKRDRIRLLEQEICTKPYDGRSTLDELRHRVELIVLDSDGWEEYNNAFPNGHETIATSSRGLWCGLYAVIRTLEAMHSWIDRPTIEDLLAAFNSFDVQGMAEGSEMRNGNNFSVDQVASALFSWGRSQGLELQLGYVVEGKEPQLIGVPNEGKTIIVWIYNNGLNLMTNDQSVGHFSGMRPKSVRQDESEAILRLIAHQMACKEREISQLGKKIIDQSVQIARLKKQKFAQLMKQTPSHVPDSLAKLINELGFGVSLAEERPRKTDGDVNRAAMLATGDAEDLSDPTNANAYVDADATSNTTDGESNGTADHPAEPHSITPSSGGGSKGDGDGLGGERNGQAMHNSFPSATANKKAPNTTQGSHPLPPKPPTPAWFAAPKADTVTNATVPTGLLGSFQQPKPTHPLPSRIPNPRSALPRTTQATAKPIFAGQGLPNFNGVSVGPNGQPAGPDMRTGHPPGFKSDIHLFSSPPKPGHGLFSRPSTAADMMFGFGGFKTPAAATGAKSDQPAPNSTSPPSPPATSQTKDDEATKTSPPDSAEDHRAAGEKPEEGKGNTDTKGAAPAKQDDAENAEAVLKSDDAAKGDEADIKEGSKNDGESEKRDDGDDDENETAPLEGEKPKRKRRRKKRTGRGKDMTPEELNARAEKEKKDAGA